MADDEQFGDFGFGDDFEEALDDATKATESDAAGAAGNDTGEEATGFGDAAPVEETNGTDSTANGAEEATTGTATTAKNKRLSQDLRPEKSGWIKMLDAKKTLTRKNMFKERWFVLKDGVFSYASSVTSKPIAKYQVAQIQSVNVDPSTPECFQVDCGGTVLSLTARDGEQCKEWTAVLQKAQKQLAGAGFGRGQSASALLF